VKGFVDKTTHLSQRTVNKNLKESSRDIASCKDHNFHQIFVPIWQSLNIPRKKL